MSSRLSAAVSLLDWQGNGVHTIQSENWTLRDRSDMGNRLYVKGKLSEAGDIESDQELIYDNRRFAVLEAKSDRAADIVDIKAVEVQAELSSLIIEELKMQSWTVETAVNRALRDTRWTAGELQDVRPGRSEFEDISVLDALKFIARHQDARIVFDSMRRRVNIYQNAGRVHEHVFTYGRELTNIEKTVVAPRTTRIYPTGADDMGIASVNGGVAYVENFDYYRARGLSHSQAVSRFLKEEYWSDNRYEIAENLKRDAEKRLEEESWPQITYKLTAAATLAVDGVDDFDLRTIHLGDQVYVWDQEVGAKLRAEVTAVTTSSDASENELILSALPDSLGSSIEGRYFGDSGRATDGPNRWTSPVPPRPSMPILESVSDLGVGKVRWNGQDEHGNYDTIPERFGTLETIIAPYDEDGSIPSPDGDTAFSGTVITNRNGGISTVSFAAEGMFAVWFYLVGYDARTRGPYSEPLSVEVEALVDTEAIRQVIEEAQKRIDDAQEELDAAMERVRDLAEQWEGVDFPQLQQELEDAKQAVADAEERLEQAEQGVSESKAGLAQLRDERLPELESKLGGIESAVADYDQRIRAAQDGADQARATADRLEGEVLPALDDRLADNEDALEAAEGTLSETRLGMENLRDVQLPDLDRALSGRIDDAGQWREVGAISGTSIRARSIQTSHLRIQDNENLWADTAQFDATVPENSGVFIPTDGVNFRTHGQSNPNLPGTRSLSIRPDSGAHWRFLDPSAGWVDYTPGDQFRFSCILRLNTNASAGNSEVGRVLVETRSGTNATGLHLTRTFRWHLDDDLQGNRGQWRSIDHIIQDLPSGTTGFRVLISGHTPDPAVAAAVGWVQFGGIEVRRMNAGRLIVDGSIQARHIVAESIAGAVAQFLHIEAHQIDTEGLAAHLATIIRLDAGQITSGRISTSLLNAEEVAGAVANFLTLDALEINVEELAGEIANIIEITAESIASRSISTRHLAIADFENLLNDDAIWDFRENGLYSSGGSANWESGAGLAAGWSTITNQAQGPVVIRYNANQHSSGSSALRFTPSLVGVPVEPGDSFYVKASAWVNAGSAGRLRMRARYTDDNWGSVTWRDIGDITNGGFEHQWTVPDSPNHRRMDLAFWADQGGTGNAQIGTIRFRRMHGGELVVDGSITARHILAESVAGAVGQFIELHASQLTAGVIDTDRLNVSSLATRMAAVINLSASNIVAGQFSGERINVVSLFGQEAFISRLYSEAVEAIKVTTERIITGDIIATGTIDVEHLNVTERMVGSFASFLRIEAGMIDVNALRGMTLEGGLVSGGTVRGALIETTAQANRGIKLDSNALRAWDSNGNPRFQLNVSTGNFTATGTVRTDFTGPRVELFDDAAGGQIRFFNSDRRASIKMDAVGQRLSLTYGNVNDDVPFLSVERNRAFMQYRSQVIAVRGTTSSNQRIEISNGGVSSEFNGPLMMIQGSRIQFCDTSSGRQGPGIGFIGQRPVAGGSQLEVALQTGSFRVSGGGIRCLGVYDSTSSLSANVRVQSGTGQLVRATSASKYKVDPRPLTVPDSILDVQLTEWIDKAQLEMWGDLESTPRPFCESQQEEYDSVTLKRVPGVIAEEVVAHGGKQFVEYGTDGEVEEVDYDRLTLAQIQVLKRKNEALEERIEALENLLEVAA